MQLSTCSITTNLPWQVHPGCSPAVPRAPRAHLAENAQKTCRSHISAPRPQCAPSPQQAEQGSRSGVHGGGSSGVFSGGECVGVDGSGINIEWIGLQSHLCRLSVMSCYAGWVSCRAMQVGCPIMQVNVVCGCVFMCISVHAVAQPHRQPCPYFWARSSCRSDSQACQAGVESRLNKNKHKHRTTRAVGREQALLLGFPVL